MNELFRCSDSCHITGAESCLEIVSSGVCIQIKDFSCEIQPGYQLGFQSLGSNLIKTYSSSSDDASFISYESDDIEFPVLQSLGQALVIDSRIELCKSWNQ